jgi:hypothetical protein
LIRRIWEISPGSFFLELNIVLTINKKKMEKNNKNNNGLLVIKGIMGENITIRVIESIPVMKIKEDIEIMIVDILDGLEKNQVLTLPLIKVTKHVIRDGKSHKVLESEINTKKDLRIIQIIE